VLPPAARRREDEVSSRTPFGFYVASIFAATFGALMAFATVALDVDDGNMLLEVLLARAAAALLAALSAVAAEALWRARPWAWRASRTLAATYAGVVTIYFVVMYQLYGLFQALAVLIFSSVVVWPLLAYIRNRSTLLFGTPPVHPSVARAPLHTPPPPPLPAGRRPPPWW
jgi:hypothetical protein